MSDEFNVDAAVAEIGAGLGFEVSSDTPNPDANLDPSTPAASEGAEKSTEVLDNAPSGESGEQKPDAPVEGEQEAESTPEALVAPKTWRKEAAAEFANLPEVVRQEIAKREEDMFRGLEGYKTNAQIGQNLSQTLEPFQQYFIQTGVNPYEEIHGLLSMAHTAKFGTAEQKLDMALAIMADCGIDPLDAAEAASARPTPDPEKQALQRELNSLKSSQRNEELTRQSSVRAKLDAELTAFAEDPKHPYFNEVAVEMAAFYNAGISTTLQDAYDRAVRANPVTHAKEQSRLAAEKTAQNEAKLKQARQASSTNLRTSTRQASATAPTGTMDDTLEATLRDIRNRG